MSGCDRFHELLAARVDAPLPEADAADVERHLAGCDACAELASALALVSEAASGLAELEPSEALHHRIGSEPCHRWQSLLFAAVDRELDDAGLERLLRHLEDCEACAELWAELTLVHQVAERLEPPPHLLQRCVWGIRQRIPMPVIGRRAALAVAYALTVIATLVVGNPVTLARNPAAETLRTVAGTVSDEVAAVADDGRGEFRVMLWRAWTWTAKTAADARQALAGLDTDPEADITADQGDTT